MASTVAYPMKSTAVPHFWRDQTLAFIEARSIQDGRSVCYDRHAHETFSIGAITGGHSTYINGKAQERVSAGAVVLMNPGDVHACNPIDDAPWSYRMLHVDTPWLTRLQHELGCGTGHKFSPFSSTVTRDPELFAGLNGFFAILTDTYAEHLEKHGAAIDFFTRVQHKLDPVAHVEEQANHKLVRAADYISANFTRALRLDEICAAADLSASYLIRAFKEHYGMTPHAYLTNRRIQYSREQLRRGHPIASVALDAGFADQAHFQRAFKRVVAATPGQYRG